MQTEINRPNLAMEILDRYNNREVPAKDAHSALIDFEQGLRSGNYGKALSGNYDSTSAAEEKARNHGIRCY